MMTSQKSCGLAITSVVLGIPCSILTWILMGVIGWVTVWPPSVWTMLWTFWGWGMGFYVVLFLLALAGEDAEKEKEKQRQEQLELQKHLMTLQFMANKKEDDTEHRSKPDHPSSFRRRSKRSGNEEPASDR